MATEARPAFLPITGPLEPETLDAAARFAAALHAAVNAADAQPAVAVCSSIAARAFAGEAAAWAPLVSAVCSLLDRWAPSGPRGSRSRRELRAFVAENADLLER